MENSKNFFAIRWHKVSHFIKDNKQVSIVSGVLLLLFVVLAFLVIPEVQKNIRQKEMSTLVLENYTSKKVVYLPSEDVARKVKNEQKLAVLFIDPSQSIYQSVGKLLADKTFLKDYEGTLYLVPLIYQKKQLTESYHLSDKPTLVYFEAGKQVNAVAIQSKKTLKKTFLAALQGLSMSNEVRDIEETTSTSTDSQNDTTDASQ